MLLCSNIVMNAIQFTADGTVVDIALRTDKTHCLLQVKDSGQGVEEVDVFRLFEPFYRGDPSRSRISGGTGLGLSICKAVCDRAGGTIAISNRPEGGALVTVELPIVRAPA
jgi:signal transduction histidine kinase